MDELNCIWISTNLVKDKLCNNNFDCDNCSFDKDMRKNKNRMEIVDFNSILPERNLLDDVINKLNSLKHFTYPSNHYFINCFVLKKFIGDTHFLGFNPVMSILIDNITGACKYGSNHSFAKDDKFIKIEGDWGSIDIVSPFDFALESELLPVNLKPESGKWIGIVKTNIENFDSINSSKENYFKSIDTVCANLKKYVKKYVTVGTTMYDGGERLKYIHQIIGKENYIKLLLLVLS
jgi:hypothetical protein